MHDWDLQRGRARNGNTAIELRIEHRKYGGLSTYRLQTYFCALNLRITMRLSANLASRSDRREEMWKLYSRSAALAGG